MKYLKTHILVVEDNYQDFIIFKEILSHIRDFFIQIDHADSLDMALSKVDAADYDIIFLDLFLPDSYGQDTFTEVHSKTKSPIVILSGLSDKKIALDIVKQGAQDYIVKGEFEANLLEKTIGYSIERKKYQEILEESERRSRSIFESVGIAIAEYEYSAFQNWVNERKEAKKDLETELKKFDIEAVKALRSKARVLDMNPEALSLYGCASKEEFEQTYTQFYNSDYVEYYREALRALWKGKEEMVYELPFYNHNGDVVHTLKRWRFLGEQGGFHRLLVSSEDVSYIKEKEEKIVRQSLVMEGVANASSILLGEGNINDRLKKVLEIAGHGLGGACMSIYLFDYPEPDRIAFTRTHIWRKIETENEGRSQGVFTSPETLAIAKEIEASNRPIIIKRDEIDDELANELTVYGLEYTIFTPFKTAVGRGCVSLSYTKSTIPEDYVFSAVTTLASSIGSALATATAQEELRQMNEDLEQRVSDRTEKLRQAIQELESFSYSVSHDLRAPLRTISGFTGVLHEEYRETLDAEGQHFLDNIKRGATEMSQLIDDLLNFSRMGRRKLQFEEIDTQSMVSMVFEELKAQVPLRRIELKTTNLLPCKGDQSMVRQVFVNLLWNAIKFSARQEKALIEVTCEPGEDGMVVYSVSDNGVGFNMQYADKLFGVFQRLHPHEEFDGTGVGLAIIQRIISRHGGKITAHGEENVGATFRFTLPSTGLLHEEPDPLANINSLSD